MRAKRDIVIVLSILSVRLYNAGILCQKERTGLVFLTPPPLQNSNNPAVSWGAKIHVGEKIWQISPFILETVQRAISYYRRLI